MKTLLNNLGQVLQKYPEARLNDAFAKGQIESKFWLVDELIKLNLHLGTVFVLGGWYGILPAIMFESDDMFFNKIRSFDIDESCAVIAETMNRDPYVLEGWQFKATTADMYELDYDVTNYVTKRINGTEVALQDCPDTIINTSCEHLKKFSYWWNKIPSGKLVVLQSNNFFDDEEHVNCVNDLDEFKKQTQLNQILFEGSLDLEKYTRFMLIGLR